jgi:hypothetical protein
MDTRFINHHELMVLAAVSSYAWTTRLGLNLMLEISPIPFLSNAGHG